MLARLAIATVTATVAVAAPAPAATVGVEDGALVYSAAAGEYNELNIMLQGGRLTVQDGTVGHASTLPVTAEPPCEPVDNGQSSGMMDATCPADVERMLIDVGDGGDYVGIGGITSTPYPTVIATGAGGDRVWGGPSADEIRADEGDDTLTPNGGRDVVTAGAGDDTIDAIDGFPDEVACGDGYDLVDADDIDVLDGCETVRLGTPQERPDPPVTAPAAPPAPPPSAPVETAEAVAPPSIVDVISAWPTLGQLVRRGLVARVLCGDGCYVTSQLRLRSPSVRRGYRILGEGRAQRSDGGIVVTRTRLRPAAIRRLRALRAPHLTLRLAVTSGTRTTALSRRIRLSASR